MSHALTFVVSYISYLGLISISSIVTVIPLLQSPFYLAILVVSVE